MVLFLKQKVSVIEGQTSDPVWTLKHPDKSSSILGLCWLGPMSFCSVDGMGTLRVWETDNLKSKLTIGIGREDQQVGCISLLANLIVSVSLSGRLNIVSNTDNESRIVHRIEGHSTAITSMSTVFCCAQLISISAEGHLLFIKNADSDNPQMISSFDEYRLKDDKLYSTRLVSARYCTTKCWIVLNNQLFQFDVENKKSKLVISAETDLVDLCAIDDNSCVVILPDRTVSVQLTTDSSVSTFDYRLFHGSLTSVDASAGGRVYVGDVYGNVSCLKIEGNSFVCEVAINTGRIVGSPYVRGREKSFQR
ncbi:hypothetical protein ACOME3_006314 [Neoechinorhynchus agilis]